MPVAPMSTEQGYLDLLGRPFAAATIAIIDDDDDCREALALRIRDDGYIVKTFQSGRHFLTTYRLKQFQLSVMDVCMPDMNGYDVLRGIHAIDASIPVIAITGRAMEYDRLQARAAGFADFVTKPFLDMSGFLDVIAKRLR